jgi:hypothetical protein
MKVDKRAQLNPKEFDKLLIDAKLVKADSQSSLIPTITASMLKALKRFFSAIHGSGR